MFFISANIIKMTTRDVITTEPDVTAMRKTKTEDAIRGSQSISVSRVQGNCLSPHEKGLQVNAMDRPTIGPINIGRTPATAIRRKGQIKYATSAGAGAGAGFSNIMQKMVGGLESKSQACDTLVRSATNRTARGLIFLN